MIRPHSSSNSQRSHQSSHSTARGNTVSEAQACAYTGRQPREPICKLPKQETTLIANDNRKSNRVLSYVIPPILVAAVAYSCYCWYYLCDSWYLRNGRRTTGICLIVFQVLILLLMGSSFFRIVLTPAGYIPNAKDRARAAGTDLEQFSPSRDLLDKKDRPHGIRPTAKEVRAFMQVAPLETERLWIARMDATDGTRYCATCEATKYDRVHHCSEVNRCVKKFDHFCPWVGGPLGHTRYKFFFQFVTYVAIYCIFLVVTFGVAVSQRKAGINRKDGTFIPDKVGLWYSCIALGGLFGLMMVPFSLFHGRQIMLNQTTLESIDAHDITIIYQTQRKTPSGEVFPTKERVTLGTGVNPFDLGLWRNWQQVMGEFKADRWVVFRILGWLLPVQGSPGDGLHYPWNPTVLEHLASRDTGINVTLLAEGCQTSDTIIEDNQPSREKLPSPSSQI